MSTSRADAMGIVAPPHGWTPPLRPARQACGCGGPLEAVYLEPMFWNGRLLANSGCWELPAACGPCLTRQKAAQRAQEEREEAEQRKRQSEAYIASSGFARVHESMELDNWDRATDPAARAAVQDWLDGRQGLYLFGPPGTGKTHVAAGALKARIRAACRPGAFRIVPELALCLRRAAKRHEDEDLIEHLSNADALVLDDLGVERVTDFVAESLYLLIDRRWRDDRRGLIVTSNLSLDQLASRIGDRLASRIAGLCRVIKLDGSDRRLSRGAHVATTKPHGEQP